MHKIESRVPNLTLAVSYFFRLITSVRNSIIMNFLFTTVRFKNIFNLLLIKYII